MTCTDEIVDNLKRASYRFKFSFIMIPIALLLHIIGFSTKNWLEGEGRQGLWKYCRQKNIYECCSTHEFYVNVNKSSEMPAFINATRVFQSFGLFGASATIVLIIVCICHENTNFRPVTTAFSFGTGVSIVLGSIIYGGRYSHESLTSNNTIAYSYVLCTTAGIIFLIVAASLFNDKWKRGNSVPASGQCSEHSASHVWHSTAELPALHLRDRTALSTDTRIQAVSVSDEHSEYSYSSFWESIEDLQSLHLRDSTDTRHSAQHLRCRSALSTDTRNQAVSDQLPEPSVPPIPDPPLPGSVVPSASNTRNQDSGECSTCLDAPIETAFLPCGHNACCVNCSEIIRSNNSVCPICRLSFVRFERIYRT